MARQENSVTRPDIMRNFFKSHGHFCAKNPWEVVIATVTFLVLVLTFNCHYSTYLGLFTRPQSTCVPSGSNNPASYRWSESTPILEVILVTIFRALSIIHCFYRFRRIHRIGSSLIWLISVSYLCLIFILYSVVVVSLGTPDFNVLIDSYFLILLLLDMSKVTRMAQFSLSTSSVDRISVNLAHSMFVLAPALVLNSFATILLMGTGLLTGFKRLELLSLYSIIYQIVNFISYVTFYPSALAIILDLMFKPAGKPGWNVLKIIKTLPNEDSQSPVVQHVRGIATSVLICLHVLCKWPMEMSLKSSIINGFTFSTLLAFVQINFFQIVFLSVVWWFSIRYLIFYKDIDEAYELRCTYIEELSKLSSYCSIMDEPPEMNNYHHHRSNENLVDLDHGDCSTESSSWSEVFCPKSHQEELVENLKSPLVFNPKRTSSQAGLTRSLEDCIKFAKDHGYESLSDEELVMLVESKHIRVHMLEKILNDHVRGVEVRRKCVLSNAELNQEVLDNIPYIGFDYETVMGVCAESVIGYMTVPLGAVGPLKLDGREYMVPMATTEGCLIASTNRGCSALKISGVKSCITNDGMTRAPVLRFDSITRAADARLWLTHPENFDFLKQEFDSTSRFARLKRLDVHTAGRDLYVRFVAITGDAMGMNMLSKATEHALNKFKDIFEDAQILSLSGNVCSDKKPAAINWLEGRGKSVTCEAIVPAKIVETVLKTTTAALCDLNTTKNLTGSAMSGSIGGFNAHAANIVTAIFIATGQDAAQNVGSSNCITLMEPYGKNGDDLYMTVTMPSIEVGTVGGGTVLSAQSACLEMLGVKGSHPTSPGEHARQLARIICATVLAGELSLMSALAAGHLVKSHLRHNRSTANFNNFASS